MREYEVHWETPQTRQLRVFDDLTVAIQCWSQKRERDQNPSFVELTKTGPNEITRNSISDPVKWYTVDKELSELS